MSQSIASSLPSSPLTAGPSAPRVTRRSTIKFGQAVIWPCHIYATTHGLSFLQETPQAPMSPHLKKGGEPPCASSSPLLKEPHTSPQDTLDLTKSLTDPSVPTEDGGGNDDDDEMPAPARMGSPNTRDIHESSKQ